MAELKELKIGSIIEKSDFTLGVCVLIHIDRRYVLFENGEQSYEHGDAKLIGEAAEEEIRNFKFKPCTTTYLDTLFYSGFFDSVFKHRRIEYEFENKKIKDIIINNSH